MLDALGSGTATSWHDLARLQGGVLGRAQALSAGMHRRSWDSLISEARTQLLLPGVVLLGSAPPDEDQLAWAAVLYAGQGAALAGLSALRREGVRVDARQVDVAVPAGRLVVPQPSPATRRAQQAARRRNGLAADPRRDRTAYERDLVVVPHQVLRLADQVHPVRQPPRVRVAHAVLQAAGWATSAAAAEAFLCMTVQQGRATPGQVRTALGELPKLRRRALVREVLDDLEQGATARSELLFLRLLRASGLPGPDVLQRPVRLGTDRRYLDAWWERRRLHVEVDGAHHRQVGTWADDMTRSNGVALAHRADRLLQLRFLSWHLRHQEGLVVAQMRNALLP